MVLAPSLLDPTHYITAFAGGMFGAAIGALPAFVFTGFMVLAGEALGRAGGNASEGGLGAIGGDTTISTIGPAGSNIAVGTGSFTGYLGFGPIFGPHISFAAGAAAAAYAAKKGYIDDGKNILWAAGTNHTDVLLVGGIFGVIGQVGAGLGWTIGIPTDPIATMVYVSAFIHRIAFGYSIIGEVTGDGIFDVSPWERDEDEAPGIWLPWQYQWTGVTLIGFVGGVFGGAIYLATGSVVMGFGISAASLVFLQCGVDNIPVTHHMTLPGSVGALGAAAAGYSPTLVVIWGAIFGIFGALAGEVLERVFYMHGSTHVDPPAGAIALSGVLSAILTAAGILGSTFWAPLSALGL